MIKQDWCKLKYDERPNKLICERCNGEHEMPTKPTEITIYVAIINGFLKVHKRCKASKNNVVTAKL